MQRSSKIAAGVLALSLLGAAPAFAVDADPQNGQGVCNGTEKPGQIAQCGNPQDPTANLANQGADPLFIGAGDTSGGGIGAAVAVGNEFQGGIARVGVAIGDGDNLVSTYAEDYTAGNVVVNIVHSVNRGLGCLLVKTKPCKGRPDANRIDIRL